MEVAEMQPDEYLQGHHICTLATATKAGTPHASAFWYASEGLDLYLAVDERSTTAPNLSENPDVASVRWYRVVVYDLRAVESGGKQQGTFFAVNFREDLVHQVFRGVTPGQAQEIATHLTPRALKEGAGLFRQGPRGE